MSANNEVHLATARSGYKICSYQIEDIEHLSCRLEAMSIDEHFDAWAVFQRLALLAKRHHGEASEAYEQFLLHFEVHGSFLSKAAIARIKKELNLSTSIDLMRFAAQLTENVLTE